jgi:hypothetical protein
VIAFSLTIYLFPWSIAKSTHFLKKLPVINRQLLLMNIWISSVKKVLFAELVEAREDGLFTD